MHFHGRLDSYLGIGVNNLIKEGAILTTKVEDILINYPQFKDRMCRKNIVNQSVTCNNKLKNKNNESLNNKRVNKNVKVEYIEIYNIIKNGFYRIDEILEEISNKDENNITSVVEKLVSMELEGLIEKNKYGEYKIIE